ncbi:hypothetical protein B0H15DRAFT_1016849 [Mycena belliarum]|uniref:C-8 sterol isomerase n=1 Tax=Mycena belliarum TaxID=1033014 RepID=A0AAD6XYK2_9AGAR|nr:hypothetical protein B0H15DRAFT_1016849 [Mycena belliae]
MNGQKLQLLAHGWAQQTALRAQRVAQWATYQAMLSRFRADNSKHKFIFANIGCGLGEVSYRAIHDGIPARQTLSEAPFVAGDLLDEEFLPRLSHGNTVSAEPDPDLWALETLGPLQNRITAIFAERLFHLFPFGQQADLAARLAPLLTRPKARWFLVDNMAARHSWRAMWEPAFPKGTIQIQTEVIPRPSDPESSNLWWSVRQYLSNGFLLARAAIGAAPAPNETASMILDQYIVVNLRQTYFSAQVNINTDASKWMFNSAGGAIGALYIVHRSITE